MNEKLTERIEYLCNEKGIAISTMLKACGLSSSTFDNIKKGSKPSFDKLEKIADYFGVSTDYLLGRDVPGQDIEDMELKEILEYCANRPDGKMLFSLAKDATAEDVLQAMKIIEALKNKD